MWIMFLVVESSKEKGTVNLMTTMSTMMSTIFEHQGRSKRNLAEYKGERT